jgi:glycosyltransferase involved in cell wall biosynthesis
VFELLEAISIAGGRNPRVIVGSHAGFDETSAVQKTLDETPLLRGRVKLLPACRPDEVWEYLCAADIFAFPSHQRFEGMPNSLLEAMVMGVPAVAFASRPVLELEAGTGALLHVPAFHTELFAEAILQLATSSGDRFRMGENGRSLVLDRFMVRKNMTQALQWLTQKVDPQPCQHFRESELSTEVPKHPSQLEASSKPL